MSQSIPLEEIIAHMSDMIFIMTADSPSDFRYTKMNPAAMHASGLNEHAYGALFHDVVVPAEADILQGQYQRACHLGRPVSFILNHDGRIGESILNPVLSKDGTCRYVVGTARDITDRYQREQRFKQQAHQDALTGLLNRRGLETGLNKSFTHAKKSGTYSSVFVIDVDNLKQVNDVHGHVVGDLYLRNIADRICRAVRLDDMVSRFGGDEFLIVANVMDTLETSLIAQRILQAFESPWPHHDVIMPISVSIGIATYPLHGATPWQVIQAADKAMYEAKRRGGGRYEFVR